MTEKRIRLLGGMSWESTRTLLFVAPIGSLRRRRARGTNPLILIDSLDFSEIVRLREAGDWDATGRILAASAERLERGGATVLAITANTMHINVNQVIGSVGLPVIDIREAIVWELRDRAHRRSRS